MTPQEKHDELIKALRSPGGLQNDSPSIIKGVFDDPTLRRECIKDLNLMADRTLFFYQGEIVFVLDMPWLSSEDLTTLTERFKSLLK
jgi:hypothetical protein